MIESLRTTQIASFKFATPSGFLRGWGGGRRRGTKIIRARVRARENPMKPFVRTSFLDTRPSCLPSPGRPFFCTEDRKPNFYLGSTGSPVTTRQIPLGPSLGKRNMQTKDVCSSKIEILSSLNCVCCRMLQFEC